MSNKERDPYLSNPMSAIFIDASFESAEVDKDTVIPKRRINEIAASLGMNENQATAFAYLAARRVNEFLQEVDDLSLYGVTDEI